MHRLKNATISVLALGLLAGAAPGVAAQDEASEPVGVGGRVEVPEAGFAMTLPEDWTYVRPQASDIDSLMAALAEMDPELAEMGEAQLAGGGISFSLLGFAPTLPGSFAENCNVISGSAEGLSLDFLAAANLSQLNAIGWDGELTMDEVPSGPTARIDYDAEIGGQDLELVLWVYVDGETQHNLTCTNTTRPDDSWRFVAETVEFLPLD